MKTLRWILAAGTLGAVAFGFVQWRRRDEGASAKERLGQLTKAELYRRARATGIEGRSRMNKAELVEALVAARNGEKPEVRLLSAAAS